MNSTSAAGNSPGKILEPDLMKTIHALIGCVFAGLLAGCATGPNPGANNLTLKDAYKNDFLIGVAINQSQFFEEDQRGVPIIKAQFNSTTPENILKWESVHPPVSYTHLTLPTIYS